MTALFVKIAQVPINLDYEFHIFRDFSKQKKNDLKPSWETINETFISKITFNALNKVSIIDPLYFFDYKLIRSPSNNDRLFIEQIDIAKNSLKKQFEEYEKIHESSRIIDSLGFVDDSEETNYQCIKSFLELMGKKFYNGESGFVLDIFLLYNYFHLDKLVFMPTERSGGYWASTLEDFISDNILVNERYSDIKKLSGFVLKDNKIKILISPYELKQKAIPVTNSFGQIEVLPNFIIKMRLGDLLQFSPSYYFHLYESGNKPFLSKYHLIREIDIFSYYPNIREIGPSDQEEEFDDSPIKVFKSEFSHLDSKHIKKSFLDYIQKLIAKLESDISENIYFSNLELEIPFYEIARIVSISTEKKLKIKHDKEIKDSERYQEDHFNWQDDIDAAKDGLDDLYSADPDWMWNID